MSASNVRNLKPEEANRQVEWLRAGEDAFIGSNVGEEAITAKEALFFRGP